MRALLDELERSLTDLLQMGLATAGPDMARKLTDLGKQAEYTGFHTGAELFKEIGQLLADRSHDLVKSDTELTAAVFRAAHYITLCRQRLTEEDIRARWQEGGTI